MTAWTSFVMQSDEIFSLPPQDAEEPQLPLK